MAKWIFHQPLSFICVRRLFQFPSFFMSRLSKLPHNNRVSGSVALKTNDIWTKTIGYDPYAAAGEKKDDDNLAAEKSASILLLAKMTNLGGADTRGACRKCGMIGHLTFQCRNEVVAPATRSTGSDSDSDSSSSSSDSEVNNKSKSDSSSVDGHIKSIRSTSIRNNCIYTSTFSKEEAKITQDSEAVEEMLKSNRQDQKKRKREDDREHSSKKSKKNLVDTDDKERHRKKKHKKQRDNASDKGHHQKSHNKSGKKSKKSRHPSADR